jgi:hypothetical protein
VAQISRPENSLQPGNDIGDAGRSWMFALIGIIVVFLSMIGRILDEKKEAAGADPAF